MQTYYYKQIDRQTGELIGLISYNGIRPKNDNEKIFLDEIIEEEFFEIISTLFEAYDETEEE